MDSIELLVHVNARARRQDDQRYLALAQSIIDYEPATIVSTVDEDHDVVTMSQELSQMHPWSSPSFGGDVNNSPTPGPQTVLKDHREMKQANFAEDTDIRTSERRTDTDYNPPYKNPFRGAASNRPPRSVFETPAQSDRPRTAPEQSTNTVQVPDTRSSLRRSHSDSSSFGSLPSHVSDSQPSQGQKAQRAEAGSPRKSLRGGMTLWEDRGLVRSHSQSSLSFETGRSKRRKLQDVHDRAVSNMPRPSGTEGFLLVDRSTDWTSSPPGSSMSHSSSIAITATPSQPVQAGVIEEPVHVSPPVIVISSDSSEQRDGGQSSTEVSGVEPSEPLIRQEVAPSPSQASHELRRPLYSSVFEERGLKTEVCAPEPAVGEKRFVTHITKTLESFATDLPFARFFRPVTVKREVKVLERGYWLLEVSVVDRGVAEVARSAALGGTSYSDMQQLFRGKTAAERLAQYEEAKQNGSLDQFGQSSELGAQGLWTEEELVGFWRNISSFIENGKAGWGTRIVGEEVSDGESGGSRKVRIRIFTWGEVIGHVYLAVWVLSDKLAARIPMRWIAGDGSCIVVMAGTRSGRGTLGAWCRKGPAGERGGWGVG